MCFPKIITTAFCGTKHLVFAFDRKILAAAFAGHRTAFYVRHSSSNITRYAAICNPYLCSTIQYG
jgi:hypothetical protein